ncbi:MAG TPA: GNAT family N-acetyltransferase [Sediminispirochaeta sp.]|nr:GNAT family N-acetyltransferase [Sediminispirochaeta sp.]
MVDMEPMSHTQINEIKTLSPELEKRIQRNPLLQIDTFIIPSPYIKDKSVEKDYQHSLVWIEEGEILGYLLVYSDREKRRYNIYKLVTSPFARGRGIGTLFIEHLAQNIAEGAKVYLYLWEKQTDTLEFFQSKGFQLGESIVYRNLIYHHLCADKDEILIGSEFRADDNLMLNEEIGKTRHDARKTIRLLSHMVEMLSIDNCGRIIEDINRETTTLINILNSFRDTMNSLHEVNLKELVLERIIPYVEASEVDCELRLSLDTNSPIVLGYYVNFGRALINIVSNSLEAIHEAERKGLLEIEIRENEAGIVLLVRDNGVGISADMLKTDENNMPAFVGNTTKNRKKGEGLGTIQIYSTFGAKNIRVSSTPKIGTIWQVQLYRPTKGIDKWFARLERRYNEFKNLSAGQQLTSTTSRTEIISYIWQMRKMEIFLFDMILQFSRYQNIRVIYRTLLSYLMNRISEKQVHKEIKTYRSDHPQLNNWLLDTVLQLRKKKDHLEEGVDLDKYQGALFKSYGQAIENIIIFTMDPITGDFLATDRKLAEHLDLAAYLNREKDQLLRGEFVGDTNDDSQAIFLGVWSVVSDEDLIEKLKLIRTGVKTLIRMGIHGTKRLSFYQTTYIKHSTDIDSDISTTFGEFSRVKDEDLHRFTRQADDELQGMIAMQD